MRTKIDDYKLTLQTPSKYILAAVALAIGLLVLRSIDTIQYPQFFAEDLKRFWIDNRNMGWKAFISPYQGYLHLAPRMTAAVGSSFPYRLQPSAFVAIAIILSTWTAVTIATTTLPRFMGPALSVAMFAVPHTGEVFAVATNEQWILACALPIIAATRSPASGIGKLNQLVFTLASGMTGPFSLFAAPLFIIRAIKSVGTRDMHGILLSALACLAAAIQGIAVASNPPFAYAENARSLHFWHSITLLIGRSGGNYIAGGLKPVGLVLIVLVVVVSFCGRGTRFRSLLMLYSTLLLSSVYLKFHSVMAVLEPRVNADRYFYISNVILLWLLISLAWTESRKIRVSAVALLISLLVFSIHNFEKPAAIHYRDWQEKSDLIGTQDITITTPPGWQVFIPSTPSNVSAMRRK